MRNVTTRDVLNLWSSGFDTLTIASRLKVQEATVYNALARLDNSISSKGNDSPFVQGHGGPLGVPVISVFPSIDASSVSAINHKAPSRCATKTTQNSTTQGKS